MGSSHAPDAVLGELLQRRACVVHRCGCSPSPRFQTSCPRSESCHDKPQDRLQGRQGRGSGMKGWRHDAAARHGERPPATEHRLCLHLPHYIAFIIMCRDVCTFQTKPPHQPLHPLECTTLQPRSHAPDASALLWCFAYSEHKLLHCIRIEGSMGGEGTRAGPQAWAASDVVRLVGGRAAGKSGPRQHRAAARRLGTRATGWKAHISMCGYTAASQVLIAK